ncbi:MAG: uracil-DNA glycosylase [Erythrobacter sp.]
MDRPTVGQAVSERTASVVWELLSRIEQPVFLWNVFPFHPHCPGDPFSNRSHNASERDTGLAILSQLISLLQPKKLIAVGNDAEKALTQFAGELPVIKVRHPSYGGQREFSKRISEVFELSAGPLL